MKKTIIKYALLSLFSTFIFSSCSNEEDTSTEVKAINNITEIPTFSSVEEFNTTLNKVNSMSTDERVSWEKTKGFKSFGTVCDGIYRGIDPSKFKSLQQVKDTVAALREYLEIGQNENGEYYVDMKESANPARYLMNEDRMYIIKDVVYRQLDRQLVTGTLANFQKIKMLKNNDLQSSTNGITSMQKIDAPPPGKINSQDLWGSANTVNKQKYIMRAVLQTELIPSNYYLRRDRFSFYNYKWTLWTYWGDYKSVTVSNIKTVTNAYNVSYPEKINNRHAASYTGTDDKVYRTLYSWAGNDVAGPYYEYYSVNSSNDKGCKLIKEYSYTSITSYPENYY